MQIRLKSKESKALHTGGEKVPTLSRLQLEKRLFRALGCHHGQVLWGGCSRGHSKTTFRALARLLFLYPSGAVCADEKLCRAGFAARMSV